MKRLLQLIVCVGVLALFIAATNWMWQMAALARESAEAVRTARVQMESVGKAVAEASAKLQRLEENLGGWGAGLGTMAMGSKGEAKLRTPEASAQIETLLARLGNSDVTWASAEGDKPRFMLYTIVAAKYGMMKASIGGPEDFIEKVADTDLFGKPLNVTQPDGTTLSLQAWFRRELDKLSAAGANGSPSSEAAATVPR